MWRGARHDCETTAAALAWCLLAMAVVMCGVVSGGEPAALSRKERHAGYCSLAIPHVGLSRGRDDTVS